MFSLFTQIFVSHADCNLPVPVMALNLSLTLTDRSNVKKKENIITSWSERTRLWSCYGCWADERNPSVTLPFRVLVNDSRARRPPISSGVKLTHSPTRWPNGAFLWPPRSSTLSLRVRGHLHRLHLAGYWRSVCLTKVWLYTVQPFLVQSNYAWSFLNKADVI